MVKGKQGITKTASNSNAKYKYTITKRQLITGDDTYMSIKYTYSKLLSTLSTKKYSYAT